MKSKAVNFFDAACKLALTACGVTFIVLALAVPSGQAQAGDEQNSHKASSWLDTLNGQKKAIVGSWLVNVETPGFPALKILLTFTEDGNVLGTAQGDVTPTRALSVAHGSWAHQGGRTFASTFLQVSYETQTGNLRGLVKFRLTHTFDSAGNEWSGPYKFDFLSPTGSVIFSAGGTTQAQRIKVEPLM